MSASFRDGWLKKLCVVWLNVLEVWRILETELNVIPKAFRARILQRCIYLLCVANFFSVLVAFGMFGFMRFNVVPLGFEFFWMFSVLRFLPSSKKLLDVDSILDNRFVSSTNFCWSNGVTGLLLSHKYRDEFLDLLLGFIDACFVFNCLYWLSAYSSCHRSTWPVTAAARML